jgi:hypothetical protein
MHSALLFRLLLIFALLFAQLGGLTHGISHALAEPEQSLPHHCDMCEAYAQIDSAIGSNSINFAVSENHQTAYSCSFSSCNFNSFVAFAARAPPFSR